jgi:hypothetical protein
MAKDERGREVISRFVIPDEGVISCKADPLTEEDLAELKRIKELMDQSGKQ